jgi:Tfp pilus assembly protein PilO
LPELLNFFQKTASQSGLILEEVSPIEASSGEEKDIKTTRVNITLKGYYFDFKNFLLIVEKSARLIEIENIYFSSDELEELFTFELSARVHSY